jgi:hypothetical protein
MAPKAVANAWAAAMGAWDQSRACALFPLYRRQARLAPPVPDACALQPQYGKTGVVGFTFDLGDRIIACRRCTLEIPPRPVCARWAIWLP